VIRQTVATVDLDAIADNFKAIAELVAREGAAAGRAAPPAIIAVVKANAYGHGATQVAATLEQAGAAMLACADIEEGVALRQSGVRAPILVFGALSVSDLDGIVDYRLTPTVSTPAAARALEALAIRRGERLPCHLKIDTGMNRLGFRHDNLTRTLPSLMASPHLQIDAVYTHFATADVPESTFLEDQRRRFERATAALGAMGLRQPLRHAANSAALLRATGSAAVRHRAAAAGVLTAAETCPVTHQSYRGCEGRSGRRRGGVWPALDD
jgi:alanine racemase